MEHPASTGPLIYLLPPNIMSTTTPGWINRRVLVTVRVLGRVVARQRVTVRVPATATEHQVRKLALERALGAVVVCG